jgi:uncharacterized protein (TIGR01777 family)
MSILVTGATGLVGKELVSSLLVKKYQVNVVTRDISKAERVLEKNSQLKFFSWNYKTEGFPIESLNNVTTIIHLMGENIADKRWSLEQKEEILQSRVLPLEKIFSALKNNPQIKIQKLISTSAIGIYGEGVEAEKAENSEISTSTFLASICQQWEKAALKLAPLIKDIAILRVGVVLSKEGGALQKMIIPFQYGLGGIIGSGNQWMSWIHVKDLVALYVNAVENESWNGIINATSPHPVTNRDFTKMLGEVVHRPTWFSVPAFALKLALGEMSEVLLESQRVVPRFAQNKGYQFIFANLPNALKNLVG